MDRLRFTHATVGERYRHAISQGKNHGLLFDEDVPQFTNLLTVYPLGEVPSRRAAELGSIEADEAGKKFVATDHTFIGGRALFWSACAGSIGSAEGSHEVTGDQGVVFFASFLLAMHKK